jgi:hypothetical protein
MPDREANASEMSPSRFDCVVAALRMMLRDSDVLFIRRQPARQVGSILLADML